jgi:hypothetical protein
MLTAAFAILAIAVALGLPLGALHLREGAGLPAWPLAALHALFALGGLALLALALRGPAHGTDQGTAGFGTAAAALLAVAALAGAALLAARLRKGRVAQGLIGLHAMIAVTGFVVLAAYFFAG